MALGPNRSVKHIEKYGSVSVLLAGDLSGLYY